MSSGSAVPLGLRRNGMIREKGFYPSLWSFVPSGLSQEGTNLTSGATSKPYDLEVVTEMTMYGVAHTLLLFIGTAGRCPGLIGIALSARLIYRLGVYAKKLIPIVGVHNACIGKCRMKRCPPHRRNLELPTRRGNIELHGL